VSLLPRDNWWKLRKNPFRVDVHVLTFKKIRWRTLGARLGYDLDAKLTTKQFLLLRKQM